MRQIVGREPELEAAERFLDAIPNGLTALVLEGEPGIGKTTVWRAVVRRAETRGFRVLVTRPAEAEAKLSFSGLADLLRDVEDFGRLPAPQRDALEVALLRASQEKPAARQAVFAGFLGLLGELAADQNVLIAVDDVQWLDTPSAAALEFALRRLGQLPVGVLASVRLADEPAPMAFERALSEAQLHRLRLGPLSLAALHHLLKAQLDQAFAKPTLVKIMEASGGNPFFALEIARRIAEHGEPAPGEPLPVPEDVEDVVRARIRRLPAKAREALLTVAALSRPTLEVVDVSALAKAEEADLVQVGSDGRISFTHPLFASAVYASASRVGKRDVHRRLAELAEDPEERARHLALASDGPDGTVAAALSQAAEHANARGAPDAAAELEELALRLTPTEPLEARLIREMALGKYLRSAGETLRPRELFADVLERAPVGRGLHNDALLFYAASLWEDDRRAAARLFEDAVLAPSTPRERAQTHVDAAYAYAYLDLSEAASHARAALELLDCDEDPMLYSDALLGRAWWDLQLGKGADDEAFERGRAFYEREASKVSGVVASWEAASDDFRTARERWEFMLDLAQAKGEEALAHALYVYLAQLDHWLGRWPLALEEAERAVEMAELVGSETKTAHALVTRARVDAHMGAIDRARAACLAVLTLAESRSDPSFECAACSTLGLAELSLGNHGEADRYFARAAAAIESMRAREPVQFRFQGDHVEAVVALGDLERAAELVARLEERGRIFPRPWTLAVSARCRGLLLAARGELDAAVGSLGQALGHHERLEMPFELARTLLVKGQVHRRRREKRLARETLERALAIFEQLGSPLWAERTRGELARVRARKAPEELTETEQQIAELAAEGSTNREIASTLFMSPKTVEKRLAAVYRKLGIRSRGELGSRMAERRAAAKT